MKPYCPLVLALLCVFACSNAVELESGKPEIERLEVPEYSKGADISWVTELEASGHKFRNSKGEEKDCFVLMKELGLDAIRLRVWVDPSAHGNWCDTKDLIAKAKRAKELGMNLMIDFHYSDWWADPAQQYKPAAWKGLNFVALKKAFRDHSYSVLNALREENIYPAWVQIGNEISSGMLWDEDESISAASYDIRECDINDSGSTSEAIKYRKNWNNLAELITTGYDAVKIYFPETKVIVHLAGGHDKNLYSWFFDELKSRGGKWDMIGMSLYPYWNKDYLDQEKLISMAIDNIKSLISRYDCDVMIVETGFECADNMGNLASEAVLQKGKDSFVGLIQASRAISRCRGVFYWEPECKPNQYNLGAFTQDGRPTIIMDAYKY